MKKPSIAEQLESLSKMRDGDIDFSDIPPIDWTSAETGKFYRPIKKQVTLRIDADLLDWFKRQYPKYQTAINAALRQHVISQH